MKTCIIILLLQSAYASEYNDCKAIYLDVVKNRVTTNANHSKMTKEEIAINHSQYKKTIKAFFDDGCSKYKLALDNILETKELIKNEKGQE